MSSVLDMSYAWSLVFGPDDPHHRYLQREAKEEDRLCRLGPYVCSVDASSNFETLFVAPLLHWSPSKHATLPVPPLFYERLVLSRLEGQRATLASYCCFPREEKLPPFSNW